MHLGEETSRNRTRATMRIAWLLLSLSFLFHSVCPDVTSVAIPSVTAGLLATSGGSPSGTEQTVNGKPKLDVAPLGGVADPTQGHTLTQSTTAVTTAEMTATDMTADPHVPTQTQAIIINNPSSTQISISSAPPILTSVINPAATFIPLKFTVPVATATTATAAATVETAATTATADSGGSSVVSPNSGNVQTPEASLPTKTSGTELPVMLTGNPHHVETSNITKVSTDATAGQQSMTHTTISSKMSEGYTEKTTVAVTRNEQTASGGPEPNWNPGTTSTAPTQTETVSLVPDNLTKTMFLQTTTSTTTREPQLKMLQYSLNSRHEKEKDKELVEVCRRLMANLQDGNCTLTWRQHKGKVQFDYVEINGKVKTSLATQYYEEINKKATDNKTLIAILASCGALLIMIVILAVCASHHRKPYNENQQHLTEELHTVENGYHDNPTLDVMEVQPEMQEKKVALNGEFNNDSWIVPFDNLLKEDIPDEEDTHL
ncbi:podocalyxin [Xiphias gladius]|uniref:podocalyxin n=1 Tax=Xiphias gladius TaxID=8245 RepID=UPI001A99F158|nr:podocalyxin [Xiphias gladius]